MGFASSLFSVMINTGAAAGIAIATSLLTSGYRRHAAQLLARLSAPNHLTSGLKSEAWLLAYNDVYRATAVLLLALAPCVFLLKRARVDANAVAASE